ncbi:TolC family protein [Phocaeicola salanitronis]|uniref:TolC family protein n=1 Tax=Phocaeicola salanitronis TaxID=376805 RepID=UPI0025A34D04|nr:TolC family protein [Phocaeicola salanitronis]MDM8305839.1 TolC family protein [Phocaeicola salanitronis]
MSKKKRLIGLLYIAVLCSQGLCAQTRQMGIEELFRLADEQSKSIQTYRTGKEAAEEALKAAKAQRLPDVNMSLSASYWGNGKLWDRDFGNAMTIDMPHFGNNFALEAQQVVYAGGAISSGIRQAELGKLLAELDLQKNVQEIRFLLVGHYLNLYKLDNQIRVLQKNMELTDEVIANMKARREQGTVLKNDITRYELQKEQLNLQLTRVKDARRIANHQLVTTLHLPENTEIYPDTLLLREQIQTLTEDEWQKLAETNHIVLKQTQTAIQMNEQKVKQERAERLPHISIVAAEHLDGPITIEVPVLDNNFNYWYIGIGVKYNISSLFKNNRKLKQARLNVRQAQEQRQLAQEQIENAVQEGYVNFLTAFTDLRTQENSVRLADENYHVTDNRYKNEMALLTDMLDASNMKLTADLGLVDARINILYNYYKMKYITHTL